ncbi:MAG: 50S ribosomal protein L11 methyltransferase [Helicobacter sp.]|nr:50S ribosomal protein L11 methyltransferase [Helicobacter sp.]
MTNNESCYSCLNVKVDNFLWLFKDKALEITQEAIEETENGFIIRTTHNVKPIQTQLQNYAYQLQEIMGEQVKLDFHLETLENKDWISLYQQSVKPIECGKYYIRPSWFKKKQKKIDIIIDPALAFGSGHHESTLGCLEALDSLDLANKQVLDVGCGSGILSIVAKKGGAREVWCCDTDEIAIQATLCNAKKNEIVLDKVWEGSLDKIPKKTRFDVVLANLIADIIMVLPLDLQLKKGGILILSGILENYVPKILDKFKHLEKITQIYHNEWVTLILKNQ